MFRCRSCKSIDKYELIFNINFFLMNYEKETGIKVKNTMFNLIKYYKYEEAK